MRRRRTDPVMLKLRRLAHSGKRSDAATLLEETLRENPAHARAREELSRFLTNRPFTFEENEYEELRKMLDDFLTSPQHISTMRKAALKRLRKRATHLQHALVHLFSATEKNTLQQLLKAIARELQRRRKPMNSIVAIALGAVGVLALAGGGCFYLWQRSESAADALETATRNLTASTKARNLLNIHDTGLNRTLNRRVSEAADKLRALLHARQSRYRELDTTLRRIEAGEQTVVGQGVRRRAEIERRLRELGGDAAPLRTRWAELCRREQKELDQQRLSLAEELMAPLPPGTMLTGNPEQDLSLLKARHKILAQRLNIFEDAGEALRLDKSIIAPVQQEYDRVNAVLSEVQQLINKLRLLPSAHDYDLYRDMLNEVEAGHYIAGAALLEVRGLLPEVSNLRGMMQEHGQNVSAELLLAAQSSLMEGGPSFTADFPANQQQLHLLDELLTNSALRTRLIELINGNGEIAYSEEPPVIRHGRVYLKRSPLDPQHDASVSNHVEWLDPRAVWQRELDPRALHRKLKLGNRTGFASYANIPGLITTVLQMESNEAPSLARAYVLDHLLQVNRLSSHEMLSGMRYAPEMRAAAESFMKLRDECGVKLDGNCWLHHDAGHLQAEQKFSRWFSRHRKVDFAAELKRNLSALLRVAPRFCGYVDEHGSPVLFEEPQQGQLIWYLSGASMTTTPWGKSLQTPRRLSPIFSMEKTF